ncbi:unnamed protein product [Lactuca saligna]|uniref:Uncharacterized protein n=1 Tax=Lactuca saligna TaxID=75948 RepID=A0AA35VX09_LACSI|nr:unnamed protein product [Lactuca saligna]
MQSTFSVTHSSPNPRKLRSTKKNWNRDQSFSLVGQMGLNCFQDSTTAMAKSISQYPTSPTEDPRLPTSPTEDVPSSKNEVKFLFGDLKEMTQQAKSKPIDFKDDPVPRALPFVHKSVTAYGIEMRTIEVPMFKPSWVMLIMESSFMGG